MNTIIVIYYINNAFVKKYIIPIFNLCEDFKIENGSAFLYRLLYRDGNDELIEQI